VELAQRREVRPAAPLPRVDQSGSRSRRSGSKVERSLLAPPVTEPPVRVAAPPAAVPAPPAVVAELRAAVVLSPSCAPPAIF
jgi:hypothetical protein